MFALLYSSTANKEFGREDLTELCGQSTEKNQKLNITGYLYYRNGHFIQYLEGTKDVVNKLMEQIGRDTRHSVNKIVYDDSLVQRRFPDWSMQYLNIIGIQIEDAIQMHLDLLKYSKANENTHSKVWDAVDKLAEIKHKFPSN